MFHKEATDDRSTSTDCRGRGGLAVGLGGSANTTTDVIGVILMIVGLVALALLVVSGQWWKSRKRSLPDSTRVAPATITVVR